MRWTGPCYAVRTVVISMVMVTDKLKIAIKQAHTGVVLPLTNTTWPSLHSMNIIVATPLPCEPVLV